ncbi:MAG: serine hydrolase [Leptolyngbyaceae bacterium]|nr:serine hydrolase [Leptolyngbyaceae bacterium]
MSTTLAGLTNGSTSDAHLGLNRASDSGLTSSANHLSGLQKVTDVHDELRGNLTTTTLYGLDSNDAIQGAFQKANVLFGNNGNDRIQGGKKNDVLNGGSGRDRLLGNHGDDLLVGGSGGDRLTGSKGNDTLKGQSGKDNLNGGAGNDSLDGGADADRVNGGTGDDVLMDYEGGDRLTGGSGADVFGVGSPIAMQASIIKDFERETDRVKILRLGATFEDLSFQQSKGSTIVLDQSKAIAFVTGVNAQQLSADDFIFGDAQLAKTLQSNLDRTLEDYPQATGLSATVYAPDGTVWLGFAGIANRDTQTPINKNSLFGAGSITKPIVATTVLQIQEEGKLNLNDTLSQWLPDFASKIPNGDSITIRQLLGHTSGIRDYTTEPALIERFFSDPTSLGQNYTTEELLAYIEGKPALSKPGTEFSYSNSNYVLLGEIIEQATGTSLATQLQQRIFEPLGMKDTVFAPQERVNPRTLTHSYDDVDGDGQLDDLNEGLSWTGAAGGVVSTATDIAKFSQALFQGELLAPNTLQKMIKDNSDIPLFSDLKSYRYGLGVESGRQPGVGRFWGHDGATVGWQSDMVYLPDRQISAVVLASASANSSGDLAVNLVIQNLKDTVK